ncbi:hypothetical protein [Ascidiimonas aurantiaca]|uniref:hypothetical protein n=1 Tax=Ascidiimonas aurantiaca TaxID=1685432 RepID=UPI0030EF0DDC
MKKFFVLGLLFILPIVAYLFFASGVNNFVRLPVLTSKIGTLTEMSSLTGDKINLQNKITILGFLGNDIAHKKGNAFNLNQKIYKRFYEFNDFQFVMIVPDSEENKKNIEELTAELGELADIKKWNFALGSETTIREFFNSLQTDGQLDSDLGTDLVYIIDKDRSLRGRKDNEVLYGFDATSVAEINNKMVDDVKVILAEYRLALKKNNAYREK